MTDVEPQVNTDAQVGLFDQKRIHINPETFSFSDMYLKLIGNVLIDVCRFEIIHYN